MKFGLLPLACAGLLLVNVPAHAAQEENTLLQQDGWYRWQVKSVQPSPDWCCYSWKSSPPGPAGCDLDGRNQGFGSSGRPDEAYASDVIDIYVRVEKGTISDPRAFSPDCPVRSDSAINDLGLLDASRSLALLQTAELSKKPASDQRIAVLAVHAGPEAGEILAGMAGTSSGLETRKQAVFWMAQLRFAESRDKLLQIIGQDPSSELREHAAFSYAQSNAPDRIDVLIGIIEDRQREFSDRSNALFWLAESGSDQGVDYIQQLLTAR